MQLTGVTAQDTLPVLPDKYYWKSLLHDTRDLALFPKHLEKNDIWFIAGTVSAAGLAFVFDEELQKESQLHRYHDIDNIVRYGIEDFGDGPYALGAIGLTYLTGVIMKEERPRYAALMNLKTLGLSSGAAGVVKLIFQRQRPDVYPPDKEQWYGPFKGFTDNYSFFSGHSFVAWSLASVTASVYHDKKAVKIIAYSLASLVSLSRVYENYHWGSDIVAGGLSGYALGRLVYRFDNWKKAGSRR